MPRLPLILVFLPLAVIARAQSAPEPGTAGGPPPLPTAAEVRQQVNDGQYRDALKSLLRVLELKGEPAAAYDRPEMLLLRAECQLQIRQTQAAKDTLDDAVREARGGHGVAPNPEGLGKAMALSALVAKSPNMLYTPRSRTGPLAPKPIAILDRAARPAAYKALFEDSLTEVKARVAAAQGAVTMGPILDAAKALATLRALEKAGTNDEIQSKPLATALAASASVLLGNSVAAMNAAVDAIAAGANLVYAVPIQRVDPVSGVRAIDQITRRRGLVNDEPAQLRSLQQTCAQIVTACYDLHLALDATDPFAGIASDANTLAQKAGQVLTDDYSLVPH
jgi:hypothetical protein